MTNAAELATVTKTYGDVVALDGVTLSVAEGESVAVLGPNGAGKTTAISLLVGTRKADSGSVSVFGKDPREPANRVRIGATPQDTRFPVTLKVREVLELVAAHYPASLPVSEAAERFGLVEIVNRQIGGLSGGQQRRLSVALAFIGSPDIAFLDEPTTGLDVASRRSLWEHVDRYRSHGGTLLLTTHYLEEAETLADRIIVIDRGTVLFSGTVDEIRGQLGFRRVALRTATPESLPQAPARITEDRVVVYASDSDRFVRDLVSSGVAFSDLEVRAVSLEEAFVAMTEQDKQT